ncbi:MAG: sugar ABC transporter permease [Verrucomicrobia bacterium]|nr:sugar ABC transporter permease [Verrucomicrobiota bacterium]MBV9672848.1 sugar ABC transporter permease [Verrucomicrobiota bacterium]
MAKPVELNRTTVDAREAGSLQRQTKGSFSGGLRSALQSGHLTTCLLFLPPALLLFTLFVILPIFESGWFSFFNWNGFGPPHHWINLSNYIQVFNDQVFGHSLINNLFVILVSACIQLPVALWIALLISDKSRSSLVFRAIFFVPYILADVVAGLIWKFLYDGDYGLVATIYGWFGKQAPFVLATPGWAMAAILLVVVWKYFGFHMALFIAGRQGISSDVIESSRIDGASHWQTTRHVVLPMMRPVIVLALFFSILGSLQFFDMIVPLTGGGPLNTTHSAVSYLVTFGIKRMRLGFGSAVGIVLFVICVFVMVLYKRLFMREPASEKA